MPRITPEERERFHKYLDESINKMNSIKNSKKPHWSKIPIQHIQKMVNTENSELDEAVNWGNNDNIISENFDLINLNMMMIDNLCKPN